MLPLRTVALLLTIALVAAACASPAGSASPGAGTPPFPTASPSSAGDGATEDPDLGDLRVPTEGWSTDFSIASVDLGVFQGGGPPKDGIPPIDEPRFESIAEAQAWLAPASPVISLEVGGRPAPTRWPSSRGTRS